MKPDRRKIFTRLFLPRYDELTLFLTSLAFVLLFLTEADLRAGILRIVLDEPNPLRYVGLVVFVAGLLFSSVHVFTTREKTDWEKKAMLYFAVLANGVSGVAAGAHTLKESHGLLMVFPLWNIANGILLLLLYKLEVLDEGTVVDGDAARPEVALGTFMVLALFLLCSRFLELYWASTLSICVACAGALRWTARASVQRALRPQGT